MNAVPIIDPSFLLACHNLQLVGRTDFMARAALQVRGVARGRQTMTRDPVFWMAAEEYAFLVDAERGILLRYAAMNNGQEFAVAAVEQVVFDEPIPVSLFTPPPASSVIVVADGS